MKLSFGNKLFLIGVAVVAVTIISLGLIETCVYQGGGMVDCVPRTLDDVGCLEYSQLKCSNFWSDILKLLFLEIFRIYAAG